MGGGGAEKSIGWTSSIFDRNHMSNSLSEVAILPRKPDASGPSITMTARSVPSGFAWCHEACVVNPCRWFMSSNSALRGPVSSAHHDVHVSSLPGLIGTAMASIESLSSSNLRSTCSLPRHRRGAGPTRPPPEAAHRRGFDSAIDSGAERLARFPAAARCERTHPSDEHRLRERQHLVERRDALRRQALLRAERDLRRDPPNRSGHRRDQDRPQEGDRLITRENEVRPALGIGRLAPPHLDVRLDVWLERVRPLADAERHEFGKEGSFEALVRWFASD